MPASTLTVLLEEVINRYLGLSPATVRRLEAMAGKTLEVRLEGLERTVYLYVTGPGIHLSQEAEVSSDACISAPPLTLIALLRASDPSPFLFSGQVRLEGDRGFVQALADLIRDLDVDWEEVMAQRLGDPLAHLISSRYRALDTWGRQARADLAEDLRDLVQEETALLPRPEEVTPFVSAVDTLRDDIERLEQRIQRLMARAV